MAEIERLSLAQKFNLHPGDREQAEIVDPHEDDVEDAEYKAFAVSPQANQRAEMLDLVFKNGKRRGFEYSHLYDITFDPDTGIELHFSEHTVRIQGLRLLAGYKRLLGHRVIRIVEADSSTVRLLARDGTVVTSVSVRLLQPEVQTKE